MLACPLKKVGGQRSFGASSSMSGRTDLQALQYISSVSRPSNRIFSSPRIHLTTFLDIEVLKARFADRFSSYILYSVSTVAKIKVKKSTTATETTLSCRRELIPRHLSYIFLTLRHFTALRPQVSRNDTGATKERVEKI